MTYLQFHLRYNLPLLSILISTCAIVGILQSILVPLLCLLAIVVAFTFPWDNWAVKDGIWGFTEGRSFAKISYLPIEEVLFFVLQTIEVSLLCALLLHWADSQEQAEAQFTLPIVCTIATVTVLMFVLWFSTRKFRKRALHIRYAWHLLFWFLPVILIQWIFASNILSARLGPVAGSSIIVGLYLTYVDVIAINHRIWYFDKQRITGHYITKGLPWEEAAFFFITSILVAQSITILLPASAR